SSSVRWISGRSKSPSPRQTSHTVSARNAHGTMNRSRASHGVCGCGAEMALWGWLTALNSFLSRARTAGCRARCRRAVEQLGETLAVLRHPVFRNGEAVADV